jgi:hypothetical protein
MKKLNLMFPLVIMILLQFTACSSNDSENSSSTNASVVGKWVNYKRVNNGKINVDEFCGQNFSCLTYEFQTNSCIVTEDGEINNYMYKIDGDFIRFYTVNTQSLKEAKRFTLTKNELIMYSGNTTSTDEIYCKRM